MKRVKSLSLLMLLASGGIFAQTIGVTVGLSQPGPVFYVDGQLYGTTQVFLWPEGSKHVLQFPFSEILGTSLPYQQSAGVCATVTPCPSTIEWTFGGWADNLGLLAQAGSAVQTITVFPGLTSVIGTVTEAVQLAMTYPSGTGSGATNTNCSGAPGTPTPVNGGATPSGWGLVYINGTCFSDSTTAFLPIGLVNLNAYPFPGYGFVGFEYGGNPPDPFLFQYNLTEPIAIVPVFSPAKRVSFRTSPLGLQVIVDHTTIITPTTLPTPPTSSGVPDGSNTCNPNYNAIPPNTTTGVTPLCIGDYDFLPGSTHTVAAPLAQQDNSGAYWVLGSYTDTAGQSLTQNSTYTTNAATNVPDLVTAVFIPGMQTAILTNPAGLKLSVDGTSALPNYNFIWGQGTTHTISAPATQVDSSGRTWQFANWSNGGSATQTITVPTSTTVGTGFSVTANYTLLGQVQVTSSPAGLTFSVGGSSCTTPCSVNQVSGTQLAISIPSSIPQTPTSRLDFDSWSGGITSNSTTLSVTLTQAATVYTANYHTSYLLNAVSNPANDATFKLSPASPDGFFPNGAQITVTPVPNTGYKFAGWGGDLSGTLTPGNLTMNMPHSVVANLQSTPTIAPAGIVNAAGATPDGTVAPGSIISIYGANLAGALQVGPADPLAQTIGNVTVTVNNILMPLMFVSPGQINAQVPTELGPGTYTLTVNWLGQAPVSGTFTVSRDAPGVFVESNVQNISLAAALHQDGSLISLASPAKRNEIVSLYGTGFGPLSQQVGDGYAAPNSPLITVADTTTVNAGGVSVPATWAGSAPGLVGVNIVQFQIVSSIPSATNINVVVTVGGKPSATVELPVQ
jgi:uncharacterized protein (TIGR03437 family)